VSAPRIARRLPGDLHFKNQVVSTRTKSTLNSARAVSFAVPRIVCHSPARFVLDYRSRTTITGVSQATQEINQKGQLPQLQSNAMYL
jgi:hypothetical protein